MQDASSKVSWVNVIVHNAANGNLKWEETNTWNAGIDYGFLNGRISGSFDVYKRKTKDLLNTEVQVSAGTNFAELITANVGNLTNNGIEFSINANIIQTKDWNWDFGYNIGYNKSEITALTYNDAMASSAGFRHETTGGDGGLDLKIHSKGYAPGSFYVFEQIYDENGKPIEGAYADFDGDGETTNNDLYRYKSPAPDYIHGLSTSLRYKTWKHGMSFCSNIRTYAYNVLTKGSGAFSTGAYNVCALNKLSKSYH